MTVTTAKWTLEDYHRMVEAGVLEGAVPWNFCMERLSPCPLKARRMLPRAQVRHSKPITIPALVSEPEPDLAIVRRLGRAYRCRHPAPEDVFWLVEYAQTSLSKDLDEKKRLCADAGIPDHWVVNRLMAPIGSNRS